MKLQICLLVFLVSVLCLSIASEAKLGGYKKITNIKDPHVQATGAFAVAEHNKQSKTSLKFESVVSGESQVVAGINYKLILAAKDGVLTKKYQAIVYERVPDRKLTLTSFALIPQ